MNSTIAEKRKVIKRLEKSPLFSKKELFIKILHYLVDAEEEKKVLKSTTIAIDLLSTNDKRSSNVQDSMMRSKIRELRKELELYYLTEGKKEQYRLDITKSNYKIKLSQQNKVNKIGALFTFNKLKPISYFLLISNLILLVILAFVLLKSEPTSEGSNKQQETSFVSLFINKNENLDIVVGDRAFYSEFDQELKRFRYIYDFDVTLPHSNYKMKRLVADYPERSINSFSYFFHSDIENILFGSDLKLEWGLAGSKSRILQASKLHTEGLENNTVFISKTNSGDLHALSAYLIDSRFKINIENIYEPIKGFQINKDSIIKLNYYGSNKNLNAVTSYFFIKKVKTNNNKFLLFLLACKDTDRAYINNKLYDAEFKQEIIESFEGNIPDNFVIVLKINGNRKLVSSHEIIYNSARINN